jgi:hypothetical protein
MALNEQRDWSGCFRPDPLANKVEREVAELHFGHYSTLARNFRDRILFSFSVPVPAREGFLFYGKVDRGFLSAHGFLCQYRSRLPFRLIS